jgi:hypothetical protein
MEDFRELTPYRFDQLGMFLRSNGILKCAACARG